MPRWGMPTRCEAMADSAQACYRKFLALNPDAPLAVGIAEGLPGVEQTPEVEREAGDAAEVPSDFQTVTLAELYIRQGHLRPAAEVLEAIIGQEPGHEKAAALLRRGAGDAPPGGVAAAIPGGYRRAFAMARQYRQVTRPCGMILYPMRSGWADFVRGFRMRRPCSS